MGNRTALLPLQKEHNERSQSYNIVLFGAGSVGKSTVFKTILDIKRIASSFYTITEEEVRASIRCDCVQTMLYLIRNLPVHKTKYFLDQTIAAFSDHSFETWFPMMISLGSAIHKIWINNDIQEEFKLHMMGKYALYCNMDYFLDKVELVMSQDYIVSKEDRYKVRMRTTGIIEAHYKDETGNDFSINDIGGQRGERNKWRYILSRSMSCIIFVVALDQFCKCLFEDESANALFENMQLFKNCLEHRWMKKMDFVLFFTKLDLFRECLKVTDLSILYGNKYKRMEVYRWHIIKSLKRIMDELLCPLWCESNIMCIEKMASDVIFLCATYCDINELFLCILYKDSLQLIKEEFLRLNDDKTKSISVYEIELMNNQQMENIMKEIERKIIFKHSFH